MVSDNLRRVRALANHVAPAPGVPAHHRPGFTVAVLGAAGGIGQPLSLLLKRTALVEHLHLYDIANVAGVAADVSHVNSDATVRGFTGPAQLGAALSGAHLVVIPAGIPRKPGMSRDDLFNVNAGIVRDLVAACAKHCPKAILNIISNPVNSTVPIAAEVLKKEGVYDPKKLLGVTHLDVMRARSFVAEALGADPCAVDVPVVGGHAGITILPLLSQTSTGQTRSQSRVALTPTQIEHLTERVQNGGTEVVNAKAGAGSATLSMAAASAEFAAACLRALAGHRNVTVCAYVASDAVKDVPFFATKLRLGRQGVEHNYGLPTRGLSPYEKVALDTLVPELRASIDKGVAFAGGDEAHRRRAAQQRRAAAGTAGNSDVRASGVSQIPA